MKLNLTPIAAMLIATFTLTACSGGANKSTALPNSPTIKVLPANSQAQNKQTKTSAAPSENKITTNQAGIKGKEEKAGETKTNEAPAKNLQNQTASQEHQSIESPDSSTREGTNQPNSQAEDDNEQLNEIANPVQVKWRQLTAFLSSSDTDPINPLKTNGAMAPEGVAAYINGSLEYNDGGQAKDFRTNSIRRKTDYDPEFLTKAEIDPDRLQQQAVKNRQGETVAKIHFVNQSYSSYLSFKSETPPELYGELMKDTATGYIALPTPAEQAILTPKVKATYHGHTIGNQNRDGSQFTLGDIRLDADFEKMQISGEITLRNDELLRGRASYKGNGFTGYTTDPELVDEGYTELISPELMEERYAKHRVMPVKLLPTEIKVADGVISFQRKNNGLEFEALNGEKVQTGDYSGIFAGPNAQEVVGEIKAGENFVSFGATEKSQ